MNGGEAGRAPTPAWLAARRCLGDDRHMAQNALAFLDGGPADGTLIELDEPEWAPLPVLNVEVGGASSVYVRAMQRRPPSGRPWRYVPEGSPDAVGGDEDEGPLANLED
jgi:hypothetical protein